MNSLILPNNEDRRVTEQSLPGFMFDYLFDHLIGQGNEIRMDLKELAGKSSAAPMVGKDVFTIRRLADRVSKDGYDILKDAGTDDPCKLVGGLSRCLTRMAAEGVNVNKDALIIALGICAEMDDDVEDWGKKGAVNMVAGRLEKNFTAKGYMYRQIEVAPQA